jgi:hypothetical protein
LELGAASIASLIYLIDKYYEEAPQLKPTKSGKRK